MKLMFNRPAGLGFFLVVMIGCLLLPLTGRAQAPGVAIEENAATADPAILQRAASLRESGALRLDLKVVAEQVKSPQGGSLRLASPSTTPLDAKEVARRARASYLHVGWVYLCPRCDNWHLHVSGAYAIAPDAIVTCHHSLVPTIEMREAYLVAIDSRGEVLPVVSVMAASSAVDTAILRVEGNFTPVALNDNIAPGESVYLFSAPEGNRGFFSQGIVNRFFWEGKPGAVGAEDEWDRLRMNVNCDWSPGSSGAAILDECGNAVGHVSTISAIFDKRRTPTTRPTDSEASNPPPQRGNVATWMTLRQAIPARGVMSVAEKLAEEK